MKKALKIFKYLLATVIVIFALLLSLSIIFQEKITGIFISEINKQLTTNVELEKINFSLIKSFPRAAVEFKGLSISSPSGHGTAFLTGFSERKLLEAREISVSFKIGDLLRKEYVIEKVAISGASVFIFTDGPAYSNVRIWEKSKSQDSSILSLDINSIKITDTEIGYLSGKSGFSIDGLVKTLGGKVELSEGQTKIEIKSNIEIDSLISKEKIIVGAISDLDLDGNITIGPDGLSFSSCFIDILKQAFLFDGRIDKSTGQLSLNISSPGFSNSKILGILPPSLNKSLSFISEQGETRADLNISVSKNEGQKLRLKGDFSLMDIELRPSEKSKTIILERLDSDISFSFSNLPESLEIDAGSFYASYSGSEYHGSIYAKNFDSPEIDIIVSGSTDLPELLTGHPVEQIESISGSLRTNIRLQGNLGSFKDFKFQSLLDLKRSINLKLNQINLTVSGLDGEFSNINGNVMIARDAWLDELSFSLADQNIILNGKIDGFDSLIGEGSEEIGINAALWADRLSLNQIKKMLAPAEERDQKAKKTFTKNISADLKVNIDSLILGSFRSAQFNGILAYRDGFYNIRSFDMLALEGSLSGNAAFVRNSEGGYLAKSWVDIFGIDINSAFIVFNNFGQESIVADNIKGLLTGSLSLNSNIDSNFKPIISSTSVTGNYSIVNGELINFEPLRKLSRFIEVSELENIRFEELKNDLVIADSRIMFPSMDINSSAFNISLSGEQSFEGDFEYHLKVLLSDILSKKVKKSGSYNTEFGTVEDDGLGRTALYLKLEKGSGETKVSYDGRKLSESIKNDLKEEKVTVKTILNEEYGWYKNDSLLKDSGDKTKKFNITWEEADSIAPVEIQEAESGNRLFQKLKNRLNRKSVNDTIIKKF